MTGRGERRPLRRLTGVHVLLVEEDACVGVLATVLEHCGAWVTVAADQRAALRLLSTITPTVLVVATSVAGSAGPSLPRLVRDLRLGREVDVRTLALCIGHEASARASALASGFEECLMKPVNPRELCRAVARLASRSAMAFATGQQVRILDPYESVPEGVRHACP